MNEDEGLKSVNDDADLEDLRRWWTKNNDEAFERTAPKSLEYGSADLQIMGSAMLRLLKWEDAPERVGLELGIAFYALGKVARLFGAYAERRLPNDDAWFDLKIYSTMAERVREVGKWPN